MKTRVYLSFLVLWCWASLAAAQSSSPPEAPRRNLQVDPLTTLLGFVHVQAEWITKPSSMGRFSVYAGPSLHLFDSPLVVGDEGVLGLGVELGGRWYFRQKGSPANPVLYYGPWVLARGVIARVSVEEPAPAAALGGYGSLLIGQTFLLRDFWILSGGAGLQFLHYSVDGQGIEGFLPALHTTLGFAF